MLTVRTSLAVFFLCQFEMKDLTLLLQKCCAAFRKTGEYGILSDFRPKIDRLSAEERTRVRERIEQVFASAFSFLSSGDAVLSEMDLLLCALGALEVETAVIAEFMTVSEGAVRVRKKRLREKLPEEWFTAVFGEGRPAAGQRKDMVKVKMGFNEAVSSCLRKSFRFRGRARRSEYWYFWLFADCIWISAMLIDHVLKYNVMNEVGEVAQAWIQTGDTVMNWVLSVAIMFPMLAVTVRRFHDRGDATWMAVVLYLLPWVVAAWTNIYYEDWGRKIVYDFDKPFFETVGMVTTLLIYVVFEFAAAAMRVLICCKPGTAGRNEFGADPVRYLARDAE